MAVPAELRGLWVGKGVEVLRTGQNEVRWFPEDQRVVIYDLKWQEGLAVQLRAVVECDRETGQVVYAVRKGRGLMAGSLKRLFEDSMDLPLLTKVEDLVTVDSSQGIKVVTPQRIVQFQADGGMVSLIITRYLDRTKTAGSIYSEIISWARMDIKGSPARPKMVRDDD